MTILFALSTSIGTKWKSDDFIDFNDEINKIIKNINDEVEPYDIMYIGVIYMSEVFFETIKPRKIRFKPNDKYFSADIKIPLEITEWIDIEQFVINKIIEFLEYSNKKKRLKANGIIEALKKAFFLPNAD